MLTEAYYAAKTSQEKAAIQAQAIAIRTDQNSQVYYSNTTVKRDTLVNFDQGALNEYMNNILQNGYVSQGDSNYALTQIVKAQNINATTSYTTPQYNYSPVKSISTTTATADVGKVNYTVSSSYTEYKNSSIISPAKAEIKTTAHYSAYYFYLAEWETEMKDGKKQLAKTLGISEDDIGTMTVANKDELAYGWNAIGLDSSGHSVSAVVINTHGSSTNLGFGYKQTGTSMNSSDISKLQSKDIDSLILLGCNAGHLNNRSNNPAANFASKINGGKVMASDGTDYAHREFLLAGTYVYESLNDKWFREQSGYTRERNNGWIVYQNQGGSLYTKNVSYWEYSAYDSLCRREFVLTIPDMLEKMK